ncbi:hypothetical protein TNCV_531601 [Trichonephila clavipes]|nr:hypothetical protein TNCV_531601 [Trichonephila clavipes]
MVSDGSEFAVGDIEKVFNEARQNTKAKHEKWTKYYQRRRDVKIKVNDWVLLKTHPLSSAAQKGIDQNLKCPRKRYRGDEIVMPSTSGYNIRPRRGAKGESRPTNVMRTSSSQKSREHHYSPYIEEQARSSSKKKSTT